MRDSSDPTAGADLTETSDARPTGLEPTILPRRGAPPSETLDSPSDLFAGAASPRLTLPPRSDPPNTRDADRIGRYAVLSQVGEGGMGVVLSAYDEVLGRRVALKLVRGSERTDARQQERLLREAQALARLSHPNVVQVYEVGAAGDGLFIAMEFVRGATLAGWLAERPRTRAELLEVFIQAGRGLAAAHRAGLVHRDFKPSNVLVDAEGRVRVVDFGLAALGGGVDREAGVAGTPAYMAPEQWFEGQVDARSDQFSFCVALWEALHGERPFPGPTLDEIREQVARGRLPERVRVDAPLHRILVRGLSREPAARYPSMDALLAELGRDEAGARRRRLGLALAAAGLVGASAGAYGYLAVDRCGGGEARLVGVWDDAVKARAQAAFLATGAPFAAASWEGVSGRLDRHAAGIAARHRDACEAHARGEQSARLLDLRMACLSRQVDRIRSLSEVFVVADRTAVERAIDAVAALRPLRACDDAAALLEDTPAPDDPVVAEAVAATRVELASAATRQHTSPHEVALRAADAALARAEASRYRPVIAEARLQRGALRLSAREAQAAAPDLVVAYAEALASGADGLARDAALELVDAARGRDRLDDAQVWLQVARAALERVPEPAAAARADEAESKLRWELGDNDAALAAIERSVRAYDAIYGPDNLATARARQWLGTALWARQDFEAARAVLPDTRARIERIYGPDHPEVAAALRHEGNLSFVVGDGPAALAAYRRGLEIILRTRGPDDDLVLVLKSNIAATVGREGDAAIAAAAFREVLAELERRRGPDHFDLLPNLDNLATSYLKLKDLPAARATIERAMAIRRDVRGEEHPEFARSLLHLGEWALLAGDLPLALSSFERARALRADSEVHAMLRCRADLGLGLALWRRGDRVRAQELFDAARAGLLALGDAGAMDLHELERRVAELPRAQ